MDDHGRMALNRALMLGAIAPAVLLATAMGMQHELGLVPCEMCLEQRTALWIAMALACIGMLLRRLAIGRAMAPASAVAMAASGGIAIHQLGGERHWWILHTPCASTIGKSGNALDEIMKVPYVRCDVPQWQWMGLTMADLNALACMTTFTVMAWLVVKGAMREWKTRERMLPQHEED